MSVTLPIHPAEDQPLPDSVAARLEQQAVVFTIRPRNVALVLAFIGLGFALANPLAKLAKASIGPDRHLGMLEVVRRFDFDYGNSIANWYSSSILLTAAMLLGMIAVAKRQRGGGHAMHWALLTVGFLLMSVDETIKLHKLLILPVCRRLFGGSFPCYSWVVPAGLLVVLLALGYRRFLANLDHRIRWLFLGSAAVYLAGALGLETLSTACVQWYGLDSLRYLASTTAEEVLEMSGIILFIYALLVYLGHELGAWQTRIQPPLGSGSQALPPALSEYLHRLGADNRPPSG